MDVVNLEIAALAAALQSSPVYLQQRITPPGPDGN
jgi:hypothetical protein